MFAKPDDLGPSGLHCLPVLHGTQAEASAALDLQVAVEVLDAGNDPLALRHTGPRAQGDGIPPFAAAEGRVGLVGVAPGGAAVNERLELPRDVRPVGGGHADDHVRPLKPGHERVDAVVLDAFRRGVTAPAPLAEVDVVVVDAGALRGIPFAEAVGDDLDDLRRGPVSDGTAIDHQRVHVHSPFQTYSMP